MAAVVAAAVAATALAAALIASPAAAQPRPEERPVDAGNRGGAHADGWRPVLLRALEAARERRYTGEALWIAWTDGEAHVELSKVRRDRDSLTVSSPEHFTMRLGDDGGDLVDHRQGWLTPLPAVDPDEAEQALTALDDKYEVVVAGEERLLDRPCLRLEVRRRADASLRERLWVDDGSGLVLRRESYQGADQRLRLATYVSLDLRPGSAARAGTRAARDGQPLRHRHRDVSPLDDDALAALREAGWTVPHSLPGGYEPTGVYAVENSDSQPLHVVYRDGLYTVSLFQQQGKPDWESLPEGAERAADLDWHAYEWPGAVPQRLVWEASGTTFSLVGDAPPAEFVAIAESLPRPRATTLAHRLRRGLGRLWGWVSQ